MSFINFAEQFNKITRPIYRACQLIKYVVLENTLEKTGCNNQLAIARFKLLIYWISRSTYTQTISNISQPFFKMAKNCIEDIVRILAPHSKCIDSRMQIFGMSEDTIKLKIIEIRVCDRWDKFLIILIIFFLFMNNRQTRIHQLSGKNSPWNFPSELNYLIVSKSHFFIWCTRKKGKARYQVKVPQH